MSATKTPLLDRILAEGGDLVTVTQEAIAVARDAGQVTDRDAGTVAALISLARKIQAQDLYFEELLDEAAERGSKPPSPDNVSLPTYLRYADALGLTPAARAKKTPAVSKADAEAPAVQPASKRGGARGRSNVTPLRGPLAI